MNFSLQVSWRARTKPHLQITPILLVLAKIRKKPKGERRKGKREMIFNSRRAMASPILKDRMFLALNLKTDYGRRIIKLFFRITPNSIPNLAIHRDRTARYLQELER
jgi:hypothetical protein